MSTWLTDGMVMTVEDVALAEFERYQEWLEANDVSPSELCDVFLPWGDPLQTA